MPLSLYPVQDPRILLLFGFACTACGIYLIKLAIQEGSLIFATRGFLVVAGIAFQVPLPAAYFFLRHQGLL
jgi:hypothetical protein